ncbi:CD209 antigen-like protein C [Ostrea edulis]|uniref:CD209 antigen-like protein C n=1 Tax=Ostrea edulis TaxID=37623 RepID=UPI0024AFA031|nr:CD209 antigen-like protein C [Ostrea edulis]
MAESKEGLQSILDKLHAYCDRWDIGVSVAKTKIVVVRKGSQRNCLGNWKKFRGNCYMLLSKKQNQESGKIACKLLNGNLADITSESENTWLHKTFNGLKDTAWIDAADRAKEGEWRWSSTGKLLKFTAWLKGEPNNSNGKEHCAVAYTTGGKCAWYDVPCSFSRQTLCKKKA